MEEHEVIAHTVLHLMMKEHAEISKISVGKKQYDNYIKGFLFKNNVPKQDINNILFKRKEEDIIAHLRFGTGRRQKSLEIEEKGGDVYYNFYTSLGQFICLKNSPSTYYWFAFALPYSWRDHIRNMLRDSIGDIKPIIKNIIKNYTKNGQGLWFYFVDEKGIVTKETWRKTLRCKEACLHQITSG